MGLRSSSERDKLMGIVDGVVRGKELFLGVDGATGVADTLGVLCNEVSDDHDGTGGRFWFGETATFLAG